MGRLRLIVFCTLSSALSLANGPEEPPDSETSTVLSERWPLVPWAAPAHPDAPMGPVFTEDPKGSWPDLDERPRQVHGRMSRTPHWLSWAVKSKPSEIIIGPTPQRPPVDNSVPEPEITARSIPAPPPRPTPMKQNEIIVWGERLEQAHQAVAQKLESMGYRHKRRGNGFSVWRPEGKEHRWKPTVTIFDDGWFTVKSGLAAFQGLGPTEAVGAPAHGGSPAPSFDRAPSAPALSVGFEFASRRQKKAAEARVARQIHHLVQQIADARADGALLDTLESLPDELDSVWYGGATVHGDPLPTVASRQEYLLRYWATRAETRAGETVREAVADYLIAEVHPEAPLSSKDVAEAEEICGCDFPWPWRRADEENRE